MSFCTKGMRKKRKRERARKSNAPKPVVQDQPRTYWSYKLNFYQNIAIVTLSFRVVCLQFTVQRQKEIYDWIIQEPCDAHFLKQTKWWWRNRRKQWKKACNHFSVIRSYTSTFVRSIECMHTHTHHHRHFHRRFHRQYFIDGARSFNIASRHFSKTIRPTYFWLNLLFSCAVHTSTTIYNTNNNSYQREREMLGAQCAK